MRKDKMVRIPDEILNELISLVKNTKYPISRLAQFGGISKEMLRRIVQGNKEFRPTFAKKVLEAPEKIKRSIEDGTINKIDKNKHKGTSGIKLSKEQIENIKICREIYFTNNLAEMIGVSGVTINKICSGEKNSVSESTYGRFANNLYKFDDSFDNRSATNRVAELRKEKSMTVKELAKSIGVEESTVKTIEKQMNEPALETWQLFANYFGVRVAYLVGAVDRRN